MLYSPGLRNRSVTKAVNQCSSIDYTINAFNYAANQLALNLQDIIEVMILAARPRLFQSKTVYLS